MFFEVMGRAGDFSLLNRSRRINSVWTNLRTSTDETALPDTIITAHPIFAFLKSVIPGIGVVAVRQSQRCGANEITSQ